MWSHGNVGFSISGKAAKRNKTTEPLIACATRLLRKLQAWLTRIVCVHDSTLSGLHAERMQPATAKLGNEIPRQQRGASRGPRCATARNNHPTTLLGARRQLGAVAQHCTAQLGPATRAAAEHTRAMPDGDGDEAPNRSAVPFRNLAGSPQCRRGVDRCGGVPQRRGLAEAC